jgi:hypothetical protein
MAIAARMGAPLGIRACDGPIIRVIATAADRRKPHHTPPHAGSRLAEALGDAGWAIRSTRSWRSRRCCTAAFSDGKVATTPLPASSTSHCWRPPARRGVTVKRISLMPYSPKKRADTRRPSGSYMGGLLTVPRQPRMRARERRVWVQELQRADMRVGFLMQRGQGRRAVRSRSSLRLRRRILAIV